MGKITLIHLKPDLTFEEKRKTSSGDKIVVNDLHQPVFTSTSIFSEDVPRWKFWKRSRKIGLWLEGCPSLFNIISQSKPALFTNFGTDKDLQTFINRLIAKSIAKQKVMSTWQTIAIIGIGVVNLVLMIMMMRGIGVLG